MKRIILTAVCVLLSSMAYAERALPFRISALTQSEDGVEVGVVRVDSQAAFLLEVGESRGGITILAADYEAETVTLRFHGKNYIAYLRGDPNAQRFVEMPSNAGSSSLYELTSAVKETDVETMTFMGRSASTGNKGAIDAIARTYEKLYKDIDYDKERARVRSNLGLMRAAFNPIGEAAGRGDDGAMEALQYARSKKPLRAFVCGAYGIAAAMGNEGALEILLNHKAYGFLLSTTVFAIEEAASLNNERAVEFLIGVISDPGSKALWHGASQGLVGAAALGNTRAQEALDAYAGESDR